MPASILPPEQVIPNDRQESPQQYRLLSKSEFARQAGVSTKTIERWVAAKLCPAPVRVGDRGNERWRADEIERWLRSLADRHGEGQR